MKKLIILLLVLALIIPIKVNAATIYDINSDNYTLFPKETIVLEILKYNEPIKAKVKWTSSNKKVATVTSKGKVTAKAKGKATITGIYKKKTFTCEIKVTGSTEAVMMPDDSASGSSDIYISLSEYNSLSNGISYSDAVRIIGADGGLLSSVGDESANASVYVWYGKDGISNAVLLFENDKLTQKSQVMLQ